MAEKITLQIMRGDANGAKMVTYEVPAVPGMVVLDAFVCLPHPAGGTAEATVGSMWGKQRSRACEGRWMQTAWSRREGWTP